MAIRIDCYAIIDGSDLDHVGDSVRSAARATPGQVTDAALQLRFVGHVSASDVDEPMLFAVLELLADQTGVFDARAHGTGTVAGPSLDAVRSGVDRSATHFDVVAGAGAGGDGGDGRADSETAAVRRAWLATLSAALSTATALGSGFAWETRYDRGGSVDDGPLEFPTSWGHAGPVD